MGTAALTSVRTPDFHAIFDRANLPVYALNARRRLVYANPAFWELTGLDPASTRGLTFEPGPVLTVEGKRLFGLGPPDGSPDAPLPHAVPWPAVADRCPVFPLEIVFLPLADTRGEQLLTLCLARRGHRLADGSSSEVATIYTLARSVAATAHGEVFVATSAEGRQLLSRLKLAAGGPPGGVILLTGERGSGRSHAARYLHSLAGGGPFVRVDASAVGPRSLLEQLLPDRSQAQEAPGLLQLAAGGTLVIEAIEHMSPEAVDRLAGVLAKEQECRLIATTCLDEKALRARFGAELAAWLGVVQIPIPPLRERRDDIVPLALYFIETAHRRGARPSGLAADACDRLLRYDWPGNISQLREVIEAACQRARSSEITDADLPGSIKGSRGDAYPVQTPPLLRINLEELLRETERRLILLALSVYRNNRAAAAEALGLSRAALYRRMAQLGMAEEE